MPTSSAPGSAGAPQASRWRTDLAAGRAILVLGEESQEVVRIEGEPADGRLGFFSLVRTLPIVVKEPVGKRDGRGWEVEYAAAYAALPK